MPTFDEYRRLLAGSPLDPNGHIQKPTNGGKLGKKIAQIMLGPPKKLLKGIGRILRAVFKF